MEPRLNSCARNSVSSCARIELLSACPFAGSVINIHACWSISMAWMKQTGRRKLIYTNSQWSKTTWTNRKNAYSGRLRRELFIVVWFLPHDAYVTNMHSALRAVKHVSSSVCHVNSIETAETVFNQLTLDCTSGTQVFITRNMQISGALNGRVVGRLWRISSLLYVRETKIA